SRITYQSFSPLVYSSPPLFLNIKPPPLCSTLFPYTTLFRSQTGSHIRRQINLIDHQQIRTGNSRPALSWNLVSFRHIDDKNSGRSEEHTSELQSRFDIVCRLLLEKKKFTV